MKTLFLWFGFFLQHKSKRAAVTPGDEFGELTNQIGSPGYLSEAAVLPPVVRSRYCTRQNRNVDNAILNRLHRLKKTRNLTDRRTNRQQRAVQTADFLNLYEEF